MKRVIFIVGIMLFLFLPINVFALGIVPGKVIIPFSPFREETFTFEVFGPKSVKAETDCKDIITINRTIKASGDNRAKVLAHVKLPEKMEPGITRCGIQISEFAEKGQQVGVSVTLIAVVQIDVPYPGKYAKMSITAENVMPDQDLRIYTNIINLGTDDLNAQADVIIKDYKNNTVKLKKTDQDVVRSKESKQFITLIMAGSLDSGKYLAKAIYDYGPEVLIAEAPFIIGQLNLELANYTKKIRAGTISPFEVTITSLWGNSLDNTFAEIKIYNNESQLIYGTKTHSTTIAPYSTEVISSFIDATNIEPGNYSAEIILKSNEKEFVNKGIIIVEEKTFINKELITSPYMFLLIIIAIIITDAVYMAMLRKRYITHEKSESGVNYEKE